MASKRTTSAGTGKTARASQSRSTGTRGKSIKYTFDLKDIREITIKAPPKKTPTMIIVVNPPRPKGTSRSGGSASG